MPHYQAGGFDLVIDGRRAGASLTLLGDAAYELSCDGGRERIHLAQEGDRVFVHLRGQTLEVTRVDLLEHVRRQIQARRGGGDLLAPMPGVVVELRCAVGDTVARGDVLLVIESMKLQTPILSESDGRIAELHVAAGQGVAKGAALARITSDEVGEPAKEAP